MIKPFIVSRSDLLAVLHSSSSLCMYYLWVELSREVLRHSHASRAGLKLFLVEHAVHLTGLAAGRGGAGPAGRRQHNVKNFV